MAFIVQLVQRLREQDPESTPALAWLSEPAVRPGYVARGARASGASAPSGNERDGPQRDYQHASDIDVRLGGVLRKRQYLVDAALRAGSNFGAMDFKTRDRYRHAIEDLARGSRRTDIDVAPEAIARANRAAPEREPAGIRAGSRVEDPGYYLIWKGRRGFEREIGYCHSRSGCCSLRGPSHAGYLGTIGVIAGLLVVVPLVATHAAGVNPVVSFFSDSPPWFRHPISPSRSSLASSPSCSAPERCRASSSPRASRRPSEPSW